MAIKGDIPRQAEHTYTTEQLRDLGRKYLFGSRFDSASLARPILRSGDGSWVVDTDGNRYLDFMAGSLSAAYGHNHPRIVEALERACQTMLHSSASFYQEQEILLADKYRQHLPDELHVSHFLLSGADANEAAMGVARRGTGRAPIASPHRGFHGYTNATRSVSFVAERRGYGISGGSAHAIFTPHCYRCPLKLQYPKCDIACLDASFELLDAELLDDLAAVITEPMFSGGGVIDPPEGWLAKLHGMVRERGALLIVDEVQTGLGRTGTWWAFEREGVTPDVLTLGKHMGGGVPIGAAIMTVEVAEAAARRGFVYVHSNSADPIATSAASAVVDMIEDEDLLAKASEIGAEMRRIFEELAERHEIIGDVRSRGMFNAVELVRDRESKEPARVAGPTALEHCLRRGLILTLRGASFALPGNILRAVPPFTTTADELALAAEILDEALTVAAAAELAA